MDEKELSELTRKTAETLFGPPKKGEGAYGSGESCCTR